MAFDAATGPTAGFRSRPFQAGVFVLGIVSLWLIVLFASSHLPVDLTVVLLILLTVVVAIALFTAPALAVLGALIAVILVNWYLVPPYRTFEISSTDNVVALTVFALVAAVSSILVGASTRARSRMRTSESRAGIIRTVVASDESSSDALARVRDALELTQLDLLKADGVTWRSVATSGPMATTGGADVNVALDVPMGRTYRLVGRGPERFAVDPGFVESLAAAVVRSYESEQMRIEQQRASELEAIDQARTALLASVGHDLRTPLSSLRLAVDTLRSSEAHLDEVSRSELLDTVDDSTARLNEMITDMLDLSRLEAGVLLAQPQAVSLHEVVAGATLTWPEGLVHADVPEDLPAVAADPVLLERVIENLVSNSIRHGGATVDDPVAIAARPIADRVELLVRDNGPGMPADRAQPMASLTADGRADASSGLGLAIIVSFARAMDIPIEFLTSEPQGLAVRLELKQVGR